MALQCENGQVAISEMITEINSKAGKEEWAQPTTGGVIKMRLDDSDPNNVILYITNDGTDA